MSVVDYSTVDTEPRAEKYANRFERIGIDGHAVDWDSKDGGRNYASQHFRVRRGMGLSAAALSTRLGKYNAANAEVGSLATIMGWGLGEWVQLYRQQWRWRWLPRFFHFAFLLATCFAFAYHQQWLAIAQTAAFFGVFAVVPFRQKAWFVICILHLH
jgi:hypothetical protein